MSRDLGSTRPPGRGQFDDAAGFIPQVVGLQADARGLPAPDQQHRAAAQNDGADDRPVWVIALHVPAACIAAGSARHNGAADQTCTKSVCPKPLV